MVCYVLPLMAAAVSFGAKKDRNLSYTLAGASIFGLIDHAASGELFYSPNPAKDLALGLMITLAAFVFWRITSARKSEA
jgi:hypothetical protein